MPQFDPKALKMDIEEFENQNQPRSKRSRLDPYQVEIFRLKEKGYANHQVCKWLSSNGLTVTPEAVRKFIKSRSERVPSWRKTNKPTAEKPSAAPTVVSSKEPSKPLPSTKKFVHNTNRNLEELV